MNTPLQMPDVATQALEDIDVSLPGRFRDDDWHDWFARLRKEDPVHYCRDSVNGAYWSVTKHADIKAVDTNHEIFSSEAGGVAIVDPREEDKAVENFIAMDPPRHDEQRKTVTPSVAPTNLATMEPLIRERVIDILDNLPVGETFNWVDKVSVELTARMLATLFDFPYEDRRKLVYWSDITTNVPQVTGIEIDMEERQAGLQECALTFYQLWQERAAAEPKFDLISMLAHGESTKDLISDPMKLLGNIILLIVGGNDTTRNSISGGVIALNEYPDEYQKLRDDAALIPNMVSEMIRWQTPVIHMRRTALKDFDLNGKDIKKGDKVIMWYLSGNRDESVFPDADRLIIDRQNARQHVSFGFGVHRCMGNRLAEMQLRVLWEEIQNRFRKVEIVGEIKRLPNNFIRGISDVPVVLHPY
ncbi:MAG: cytochrome P450 [Gammaproteobacteria bacterium]|jgi:cytochrome P450|nr:cytochrome P450 [Gammaproteobacteria bacterium]MBT4381714.1 cytochrome P450 [Gammaproteobacteria bacterium]MBT5198031.1 cytochrome P450 [Gammaproteobacteria bacterium]MBT5442873.1 cytochrome P450 [Gammaproteobacteria bacterium]MBT6666503.1 cytochrome P450 [Gammaproteobacteria bacterium]